MLETKVVSQGDINDLDCHCNKLPALVADVCLVAAGSYIIVICQVNIETQLFGYGLEGGGFPEGLSIARIGTVDWADFESGGHKT